MTTMMILTLKCGVIAMLARFILRGAIDVSRESRDEFVTAYVLTFIMGALIGIVWSA